MGRDRKEFPFAIVAPDGLFWLGLAHDTAHAWQIALGWPSPEEIAFRQRHGWACVTVQVTWKLERV